MLTQSTEKSFFYRAETIEKKYREKMNADTNNWKKLFDKSPWHSNAIYRDWLT